MKLFESDLVQNKIRYWSISSMTITFGVLVITLFILIPAAPDFYEKPEIIKISGNNNIYIYQDNVGRGSTDSVYFSIQGQKYLSSCSELYNLPNQLCTDENAGIAFLGKDVTFLAAGKEAGASGRILGVLLSGKFENNMGKVILMNTPKDLASLAIEGFQRVYKYAKLGAALAAILFCISLLVFLVSGKRKV
ncbi:hypothetical protein [Neisseria sp.]|uniref:hypothetical protein n=1 Tax=Neisseria sp. TaxID=192066 RepID=UPI002898E70C|nr:hypothetical protein [Neisseria sp.]